MGVNAASPDPNAVYSLGSSPGESERLLRQAQDLAGDSAALLDRTGLRPGHHAIDLGCGPRGILELLAAKVAPGGRVTGVDANEVHVAMAAAFAASRGLAGVEVIEADARHTGLPSGSFDLIHARTLLVTIPQAAEVVTEMARLARPGGWVVAMEPDVEATLCYPPLAAFDRLSEINAAALAGNGADPLIGRRVPELFRQAGLADVGLEARPQLYPAGISRRTNRLDVVRSMWPRIVQMGLATQAELEEVDAVVRPHLEDPRTVMMSGLLFCVWGRKPA
jgi:SAM-dependent methyltransferase